MDPLTPRQVASQAGVNVETLRFYERRGLLAEPVRLESGHRRFDEETVRRLRFIKRSQALGFSLEEIRELLSFQKEIPEDCAKVMDRVETKIADVRTRIADLQRIQRALTLLRDECCSRPAEAPCPILGSLEDS
jgi:Hg(II)-responsive transcriptional regulator